MLVGKREPAATLLFGITLVERLYPIKPARRSISTERGVTRALRLVSTMIELRFIWSASVCVQAEDDSQVCDGTIGTISSKCLNLHPNQARTSTCLSHPLLVVSVLSTRTNKGEL